MKQCLRCDRTYDDDLLNFCLEDGELLVSAPVPQMDDSPPTVLLNETRITNPGGSWPSSPPSSPPAQWQAPGLTGQPQFGQYAMPAAPNKTLAIVSLSTGIASITIGWCCSSGMLLAPAALVTGFLALSYMKKDPQGYAGRGLAIGGIVTGVIYFCLLILFIIIYGLAIIGGGLS